jgi:hypothetical protein
LALEDRMNCHHRTRIFAKGFDATPGDRSFQLSAISVQRSASEAARSASVSALSYAGTVRRDQIHKSIRAAFGLTAEQYTLTQLRYDLRKMKGHGLLERDGRRSCCRLTDKGTKVAGFLQVRSLRNSASNRAGCTGRLNRPCCRESLWERLGRHTRERVAATRTGP